MQTNFLSSAVEIRHLQPFGIMLINMDNQRIVDVPATCLQSLLQMHHVVVLRGFPAVTANDLMSYAETYGKLLKWEFGQVMEMKVHHEPKNYLFTESYVPLHWDGAFYQEPRILLFNCIQAPQKQHGGETFFVNTQQLLADLDPETRAVYARHQLTYETEKIVHYGGKITVPLLNRHPVTEKPVLRFAEPVEHGLNPVTVQVTGLTEDESKPFISSLATRCYNAAYCYQHTWENADLLLADNFTLLHGRQAFKAFSARHLRRIQIL